MGFPCGLVGCSQEVEKGLCGGCKDIHYCCKEHQAKDWKRHKKECKEKAKAGFKEKATTKPRFHEEYKETFPKDHHGFSTLSMWFLQIEMKNSPFGNMMTALQDSILDTFLTQLKASSASSGTSM